MELHQILFLAFLPYLTVLSYVAATEAESNATGISEEQEFLEKAIALPRARLYAKENLTGDFEELKDIAASELQCASVEKRNGTDFYFPAVKSVDTLGSCVRLYERLWCEGLSVALYPGSPFAHNVSLSNLHQPQSVGPCLKNEFDNAKVLKESDTFKIYKDPALTATYDIVPDKLQFFSSINATTIYPQCGIISQVKGPQNRTEYVKIAIDRDNLRSQDAISKIEIPSEVQEFYEKLNKNEGDVLGWTIPLELGGPLEDVNVFPINAHVKKQFESVIAKVNGIFSRNESIERVHFSVNFVYLNENSTRPDLFAYWLIQDYGEGANSYDLLRNSGPRNDSVTPESDHAFIETVLTHPKGKIEFYRGGNLTDVLSFESSPNSDAPICENFVRFQYPNETFSVTSGGTCIRLFEYSNCRGKSIAIYPGSSVAAKQVATKPLDDYRTVVLSIGPCVPIEFEHANVVEHSGRKQISKNVSLTKDLTSIPDVLFDLSGDDRAAKFAHCPVRQVALKEERIEFMMTEIIRKYIIPNNVTLEVKVTPKIQKYYDSLDRNEGDVLGFALPLEFGGPMKPYNVFPQTLAFKGKLRQVFSEAAKLIEERENQNSWVALTFLYGESITRPRAALYKVFNAQESPVNSGFIKN